MSAQEAILELQKNFDINSIFAHKVYFLADKNNLLESSAKIIEERPKPFVKWVGGKRQLLKQFKELGLYPPDGFNPLKHAYFEPFVGGGAVFLDLLPKNAVISDLNTDLIITYKVVKNDVEKLIKLLKTYKYSKDFFLKIRSQKSSELSDVQIAARFIYLNRTCFNGLYRVNSKGEFNVPFGKYNNPLICDEDNLRKISKALKNVKIYNEDYKNVLKRAKKGDFIYFDPPYYPVNKTSSFTSYTSKEFLDKEQLELRDAFLELHKRGCFVMLSNSDTPFINKIYSGFKGVKINKIEANRNVNSNAAGRGKIKEVLVINY
ncbi:MAG TPA: DNA adenine methylase [Candidatus Magasanikbacteria bacterium]|nr:DNA adenine methylase [Candidatus Magasanikbacteria bacterium]